MSDELQKEYERFLEDHPQFVQKPKPGKAPSAPFLTLADRRRLREQRLDAKIANAIEAEREAERAFAGEVLTECLVEFEQQIIKAQREARKKIEDRLDQVEDRERENMVAIAKLEAANAKLELELVRATSSDRRGSLIDMPTLKSVN